MLTTSKKHRFDLQNQEDKKKFEKIRAKYKKIAEEHGAEIKAVHQTNNMGTKVTKVA